MSAASPWIDGAILSVPLAAAVWLALRLVPRTALNAAARYAIWWIALVAALALPTFHLAGPRASGSPTAPPALLRITTLSLDPQAAAETAGARSAFALSPRPSIRWLALAWPLTSALLLLRLLLSHLAIRLICRRALTPPPECLVSIERWKHAAGWRDRSVRIAASPDAPVPFAAGPFSPAILIPTDLFHRLSGLDLDRVVLHEAAHLARFDDCAILIERLLVAIFPWNLSAWWMIRQIDREREIACDDLAVERTGCPRLYADCLTRVVELCGRVRGPLVAAMAGRNTQLSRRVQLLIEAPRQCGARLLPVRVLPFAAALVVLLLASARAPRLVAFTAPPLSNTPKEEKMISPVNSLGRKLAVTAAATALAAAPAPTQTAAAAPPDPGPAQEQVQTASSGRRLAILIDAAGLPQPDLQRSCDAAVRFIRERLRPEDQVAILVTNERTVGVQQDFTSDQNLLVKTVLLAAERETSSLVRSTPEQWAATVAASVKLLAPVEGKKALVYIGDSAPALSAEQIKPLIGDALGANVAFYIIDARGLPPR
jgi:beta-lactamase regulating signal transducer with metallopeptidase domain